LHLFHFFFFIIMLLILSFSTTVLVSDWLLGYFESCINYWSYTASTDLWWDVYGRHGTKGSDLLQSFEAKVSLIMFNNSVRTA
jgi:hypothetical protein